MRRLRATGAAMQIKVTDSRSNAIAKLHSSDGRAEQSKNVLQLRQSGCLIFPHQTTSMPSEN